MSRKLYNRADVGCQADGTFGHDHVRSVMASVYGAAFGLDSGLKPEQQELYDSLRGPMPDDAWDEQAFLEEIADACDDVCFDLVDGDLLCLPVEVES